MPLPLIAALGVAKVAGTGAYILWRKHRAKTATDEAEKTKPRQEGTKEDR